MKENYNDRFDLTYDELYPERSTCECARCGKVCQSYEMHVVNGGERLCYECYRDYVHCEECGRDVHFEDACGVVDKKGFTFFVCHQCLDKSGHADLEIIE